MTKGIIPLILSLMPFFCFGQKNGVDVVIDQDGEGNAFISDIMDFPSYNKDEMFVRAVSAAVDNLVEEGEEFDEIDFTNRRLTFVKTLDNGKKGGKVIDKNHASYRFTIHLTPTSEGSMPFTVDDIWVSFKEKGILSRTIPLGKLNENNQKQSDLKKQFGMLLSAFLDDFSHAMKNVVYVPVTHWSALEDGKVIKGMNELEVKIQKGNPRHKRDSGGRTKWMYSNDNVIIFTDGKVTSVVD